MKSILQHRFAVLGAAIGTGILLLAQPIVPPQQSTGALVRVSGVISQFNFGGEGEVRSFMIGQNVVTKPAGATEVYSLFRTGDNVEVEGYALNMASGIRRIEPVQLRNTTRNLSITVPAPGVRQEWNGSGRVAQFNFNSQGDVDGILLDSGVLVRTPGHFSNSLTALAPLNSQVSVNGWAKQSVLGKTIVQAVSINGQLVDTRPAPAPGPAPKKK